LRKYIEQSHYFHQPYRALHVAVLVRKGIMDLIPNGHGHGPTTPALYTSISPTATESTFNGSPIKQEDGLLGFEPARKKQKRNKPTLSCEECVERKTKVSLCAQFVHNSSLKRWR
jgi:hypothetical protein